MINRTIQYLMLLRAAMLEHRSMVRAFMLPKVSLSSAFGVAPFKMSHVSSTHREPTVVLFSTDSKLKSFVKLTQRLETLIHPAFTAFCSAHLSASKGGSSFIGGSMFHGDVSKYV